VENTEVHGTDEHGYRHLPSAIDATSPEPRRELQICSTRPADMIGFVLAYFRDEPNEGTTLLNALRSHPSVGDIAQNPLLATLLCIGFSSGRSFRREQRTVRHVDVYSSAATALLGRWSILD